MEGHEKQVLQGALVTLEKNNYPKIFFESWDEHQEQQGYPAKKLRVELFEFLQSLKYTITQVGPEMYVAASSLSV